VVAEGVSTVLRMLDERRTNPTEQRTRSVNQLHARPAAGVVRRDWTVRAGSAEW
jgi:hypothetical protein